MRRPILSLPSVLFLSAIHATTYYSTNNSAANVVTNWHINRNGSGASPSKFTLGDIFIIQSGHSITTTANWTISGTGSKLTIETGATFLANDKVTVPDFEIDGTGTYIHNKSTANFPGTDTRTLSSTSTVEMRDWSGSSALPSPTTWGNLIINVSSFSSNWNQAGGLTDVAGNLDIRNTGSNEFRLATTQNYTLTIGGNLMIENGVLEAGQTNGIYDQRIIIDGSYIQSGGTFTRSNNKGNALQVEFNGTSSSFTQTGGTVTNTYMDWIVNSNKKLTLNNNLSIASSRLLTVNGSLNCGTYGVTGTGSFSLSSTGDVSTSNSGGIDGVITVTGSRAYNSGGSFEFHSATTSPFPGNISSISASNVVIDADVTINKNVSISGTLSITNGKLTIPAGNTVTINSGTAIAGTGFSDSKHIVTQVNTSTGAKGVLHVSSFTGTTNLPVGNGTYYLPIALTASGTNDFNVTVFQGVTANGAPNGTPLTAQQKSSLVDAVWIINKNSGSNDVSMQLSWPSALEGSAFQNLPNNQIGIAHNGGYWESPLGSGNQLQNTATRTNITMFSPFDVGQINTILPLSFGELKVYEKSSSELNIDWTSYSEVNLDHFEIQRSENGQQFTAIGEVKAKNSSSKTDYSWTDMSPLKSSSFYRINGVDIDGKSNYSSVARFNPTQPDSELALFPNPVVNSRVSIEIGNLNKGDYKLSISNLYGRFVYGQSINHQGGIISRVIQLPPDMPPGLYSLSVIGNGTKLLKQFVVK